MPSIVEAATRLRTEDRPVLFLDTCILIDIIRATMYCQNPRIVPEAVELRRSLVSTAPGCALVVASKVPVEWNNHASKTREDMEKHFNQMQSQASYFHDACGAIGINPGFEPPDYPSANLHHLLFELSRGILDLAVALDRDDDCNRKAFSRVDTNRPPSRKGGGLSDCIIVEECLELTRRLRGDGLTRKCVFCTSNSKDYEKDRKLAPELASDFDEVGLTFTSDLPWAVHEIKT